MVMEQKTNSDAEAAAATVAQLDNKDLPVIKQDREDLVRFFIFTLQIGNKII
jgi:hypothetical protein